MFISAVYLVLNWLFIHNLKLVNEGFAASEMDGHWIAHRLGFLESIRRLVVRRPKSFLGQSPVRRRSSICPRRNRSVDGRLQEEWTPSATEIQSTIVKALITLLLPTKISQKMRHLNLNCCTNNFKDTMSPFKICKSFKKLHVRVIITAEPLK